MASKIFLIGKDLGNVNVPNSPFAQSFLSNLSTLFTQNFTSIQKILTYMLIAAILVSSFFVYFGKQRGEPLIVVMTISMMMSPNILWYHHYVFLLLALLVWMGWSQLDKKVVIWCLIGLLIVQVDRFSFPYGLMIHVFCHLSIIFILFYQARDFIANKNLQTVKNLKFNKIEVH